MSRCDGIDCFFHCSRDSSILLLWPCCTGSHTFTSSLFAVLATLRAGAHPASHQRILPNTRRTTFINVMGLLPTVHFFLWVPQVHFSCSRSTAGYLVWPVPLQQYRQYLFQGSSVLCFCWYKLYTGYLKICLFCYQFYSTLVGLYSFIVPPYIVIYIVALTYIKHTCWLWLKKKCLKILIIFSVFGISGG